MVIKQKEAVIAYMALKDINEQKMPKGKLRLACNIFNLCSKLEKAWAFQVQEQNKIFSDHPDFNPEYMGFKIEGKSDAEKSAIKLELQQIQKELEEIGNLDFELDHEMFDVSLDDDSISLSGTEIGALSKLINFV